MSFTLRRASVDDAATLSALAARTFTETFGHLYRPEDLASFISEAYAEARHQALLADPDYAFWLLEHEGEAIGHAAAGPCHLPHPQVQPGDGELIRLYLLQPYQSGGHGARLMQAVLDWLLRDGPRTLWLGVWSENLGAQRFYTRYGFTKAGEYLFPVGQARDREFIFWRESGIGNGE